ncbi:hypothetical protein DJ480_08265 [Pseudomonas sp. Leaf98]|nr:hypothetical protein DJ480_08265 [Pseudomonas sp. Leaf98]
MWPAARNRRGRSGISCITTSPCSTPRPSPETKSPIVPTLRVGMPLWTLCVRCEWDAERPGLHSHAERGNDPGESGLSLAT